MKRNLLLESTIDKKLSLTFLLFLLIFFVGNFSFSQYCSSTYSTVEAINRVQVAGIDNSNAGTTGYQDFTAVSGSMNPGGSYPITVWGNTAGNYTNYITVWIDFNHDETFSSDEMFQIGSFTSNNNGSCSNTIIVPNNAVVGTTRMRVSKNYYVSQTDPCASGSFGQVEDYTINITEECANSGSEPTLTTALSPTTTNQQVSTSANNGVGPGSRKIYTGFSGCKEYNLFMNDRSNVINCVSGRWLDGSNNALGDWFSINHANSTPGTYTNSIPPMGATQLEIKTGRSSWVATSALLNYKYTNINNGDPNDWGDNEWNVYAYNNNGTYNNTVPLTGDYAGYYTQSLDATGDYGVNTGDKWAGGSNPSTADNWNGCSLPNDYFTFRHKRKGFPCGIYQIDADSWDDATQLIINGTTVWSKTGWVNGAPESNIWVGSLGANDQVEIRTAEGTGGAGAKFKFTKIRSHTPGTIKEDQIICKNTTPEELVNRTLPDGNNYSYQWQSASSLTGPWTNITGATGQDYQETNSLTTDKYYRREVSMGCESMHATVVTPREDRLKMHLKFDEPVDATTNIVMHTDLNTGWTKGYHQSIVFNEIAPPAGVNSPTVGFNRANVSGYWYSYGDYCPGQTPGQTFTVSIYVKTLDTDFKIRCYTADNSEPGRIYSAYKSVPNDGYWHRVTWVITIPSNSLSESLSFQYTYGINNPTAYNSAAGDYDTRTWFCAPQMELGEIATPFHVGSTGVNASVYDYSGNGNNGTITGATSPTWTQDGVNGGAYIFDGTTPSRVTGVNLAGLASSNMTFSAWVNREASVNTYNMFAGQHLPYFGFRQDGRFHYSADIGGQKNVYSTNTFTNNQWLHFTATYDGSNMKVYVNGELEGTLAITGTQVFTNGYLLAIGDGHNNATWYPFKGKVDDVRFYDVPLSAEEIKQLYTRSVGLYVKVRDEVLPGSIKDDQAICSNQAPAKITSVTAGSGGNGTITYRWEQSVSPFTTWTTIPSATGTEYTPPSNLSVTTKYRRVTISTLDGKPCEESTAPVTITVDTDPGAANNTTSTADICADGTKTVSGTPSGTWSVVSGGGSIAGTTYTPASGITTPTSVTVKLTVGANGACPSTDDSKVFIVNPLPATPTFTSVNPTANICIGTNVTYTTQSGMSNYSWSIPGTAGTDYTKVSGGTTSDNNVVIAWMNNSANTQISVNYVDANGCAPASSGTATALTLPAHNNTLSSNNDHATCHINGTNPVHFYDPANGHYIGSINPQGNEGVVTMSSYLASFGSNAGVDDGTVYACDHAGEQFRTAYMKRSFTIVTEGNIIGNSTMELYLPFKQDEFDALQNDAANKTLQNSYDDLVSIDDLAIAKFHSPGNEDNDPYNNCGITGEVIMNTGTGDISSILPTNVIAKYAKFAVTNFSEFYFQGFNNGSPLPITLKSFSGNCNNGVELTWVTGSENNVSHYEIYSSTDGSSWNKETEVKANGNSSTELTYTTNVRTVDAISYYRLRSVDNDGQYEDFSPISVACDKNENTWNLYPVPAIEQVTVTIQTDKPIKDQIILMDMNGRIVESHNINLEVGIHNINLNINELSKGTYTVKMAHQTDYKPLRVVKIQ